MANDGVIDTMINVRDAPCREKNDNDSAIFANNSLHLVRDAKSSSSPPRCE